MKTSWGWAAEAEGVTGNGQQTSVCVSVPGRGCGLRTKEPARLDKGGLSMRVYSWRDSSGKWLLVPPSFISSLFLPFAGRFLVRYISAYTIVYESVCPVGVSVHGWGADM